MKKSYSNYNSLSVEECRSKIPEKVLDKIIEDLELDPNKFFFISPPKTIKEAIWDDISFVIITLDKPSPSPTETKTTPKNISNLSIEVFNTVQHAQALLKGIQFKNLIKYENQNSKEWILANKLRMRSIQKLPHPRTFVSASLEMHEYKENGIEPTPSPFDDALAHAIQSLETLIPSLSEMAEITKKEIPSQRTKKRGKSNSDKIIKKLCAIYTNYTGEKPTSYISQYIEGQAEGKVIKFIQSVLEHVQNYDYERSDIALHSKIRRLLK